MKSFKTFIGGVLAGISIAIGGTAFLSVESKVLGALFFTVGLFTVCSFGLNLYTGKVCYVFARDRSYAVSLVPIWLGNLVGTVLVGQLERLTRIGAALAERAAPICEAKLEDSIISLFILAVFCNILIYIAVEGFNTCSSAVGKHLALFFGVAVFIICGFEHCVANMYYFTVAGAWSFKSVLCLLIITLGNSVGGVILPLMRDFIKSKSA